MSEDEDKSKSKEARLEEKEKMDAETQRSLAVAEMKKAHSLIEETERARKRPVILSICARIGHYQKIITGAVEMFGKPTFAHNRILDSSVRELIKGFYQTYESIRFDFQKNRFC